MSTQSTAFRDTYDLAFQVSPIILTGGLASAIPGKALPIIALLGQIAAFGQGALSNGLGLDDFYCRYLPMAGATAINNSVGTYPFADQHVAGNAYVEEPLNISLLMIVPVKDAGGYLSKLPLFTALKTSLKKHIEMGGTFAVATPSMLYEHCLLMTMTDVTGDDTQQQQIHWQIDFEQPLITKGQATNAVNGLMDVYKNGGQLTGDPSWTAGARATAKDVGGMASSIKGLITSANGQFGL